MAMKLSIDEIFAEAIMSSTPIVIVEGIDDIKTYTAIAKDAKPNAEIYAVETIDGYSAGCGNVIDAIRELYSLQSNVHAIENYVVGIIDRDMREFRSELPTEKAILVLDFYSIETHFVEKEVFINIVDQFTLISPGMLGSAFLDDLYAKVENRLLDLYYFSLEAMKGALHSSYNADYQYSFANNRRKNEPTLSNVTNKISDLDQFAAQHNLTRDISSIKKIAKGKWLLLSFCEEVHLLLQNFSLYCGYLDSKKCQFCNAVINNKCIYKLKDGVSNKTIYSLAVNNTHLNTLQYIKNHIGNMSLTTTL